MEKFSPASFCVIRTPAFATHLLTDLYKLSNDNANGVSEYLKNIFQQPDIQTALHGSTSENFFIEFEKWLAGKKNEKESERVELTLVRYLERMTTRCVPFGHFAGFAVAEVDDVTNFRLLGSHSNITHMRLDMDYLQAVIENLNHDSDVRNVVLYFKNSSLYRANNHYKYLEYSIQFYERKYNYASVDYKEYLELIFEGVEQGCSITDMINILCGYDDTITEVDAKDFVFQLIDSQLIVSEIEPNVSGEDALFSLIKTLEKRHYSGSKLTPLKEVYDIICQKNYTPENADRIKRHIESIIGKKPFWSILQTDLEIATPENENKISRKITSSLLQQVESLSLFAYGIARPALVDFKARFTERYGSQLVPLTEVLDPEIGLGYGSLTTNSENPLLRSIHFDRQFADPVSVHSDAITEFVTSKYVECINKGQHVLELTDKELNELNKKGMNKDLPESFFMHGMLLAGNTENLTNGNFKFLLKNLSGPPSCLTIGRFCYTSENLTKKVRECNQKEELLYPDAVYAEIIHLPDARVGNVIMRPILRNYEIPYLGKSGISEERQIPITDILVSVKDNKVHLTSKKLNKEIKPRLTNAHVFSDSRLPIYKFLGEVQRDSGSDWLSWHWQHMQNEKFLPRVEYKNIILKTAKWLIELSELATAGQQQSAIDAVSQLKTIRDKHSLPRYVSYVEEMDKEFVIDMDSEISCQFLLRELHKTGQVLLEEHLQLGNSHWLKNTEGYEFCNEIMIPFIGSKIITGNTPFYKPLLNNPDIKRKFITGSEWLYIKIYTGKLFCEQLLTDVLRGIISNIIEQGFITSWHYVRYNDPDYHLRLRFKSAERPGLVYDVINLLYNDLSPHLASGEISRIQLDTYDREIERYGSATMEDSEDVFSIDSSACMDFLQCLSEYEEENERWLWMIKAVDSSLDLFHLDLKQKQELMSKLETFWLNTLRGNKETLKQIKAKYKPWETQITSILDKSENAQITELMRQGNSILSNRNSKLKSKAEEIIQKIIKFGEVTTMDLVASYIHMMINRLFTSDPNKCELVIYVFLNRWYTYKIKTQTNL